MGARQGDAGRYYDCLECGTRHSAFVSTCSACGGREFRTGRVGEEWVEEGGFSAEAVLARLNPFVPR